MPYNPDKKLCGAKTRSGMPCQNYAMANGRCRLHGGKSLGGIASPVFKHGRHSKYIPARLLDRYEASQSDTELLVLRDEINLVDARLSDVLSRVDTGEAGSLWQEARQAYESLSEAIRRKDVNAIDYALTILGRILGRGQADWAAWREVFDIVERRRKLVDSEQKRLLNMQQMITTEDAVNFASALALAVKDNVTDRKTLQKINDEFKRLLSRNNRDNTDVE